MPGSGSGTIDPTTGVLSATYGYTVLFEPIGTAGAGQASFSPERTGCPAK